MPLALNEGDKYEEEIDDETALALAYSPAVSVLINFNSGMMVVLATNVQLPVMNLVLDQELNIM